ncbi:hypothetical protein [Clostridium beijerinckii]|uniref:hypothetical protein n=1 Tax=Clostridium beijerinckii TaxID=1520 RepID=UPI00047B6751|nr:hypothetical protein [Clostridium beijerinckii]
MAVSSWLKNIDENLPDVVEKLREIEVINQYVLACLERWDTEKTTLFSVVMTAGKSSLFIKYT